MTTRRSRHAGLAARARRVAGSPPAALRVLLGGLVALCLVTGVVGWAEIAHRRAVLTEVTQRSIPLSSAALEVYQSLSDADATANGVFLAGERATPEQRARYLADIERAAVALSTAAAGTSHDTSRVVAELTAQLARYSGLVATAHTNDRQGFSVGAGYLREASALVRETLLPAAHRLYRDEEAKLAAAQDDAGSVAWLAVALGVLTLGALVAAQLYLRETTRRTFNRGLLVTTGALLLAVGWLTTASVVAAARTDAGRAGVAQTEALATARITALTARSAEALTLVARSNGGLYEEAFRQAAATLDGDRDVPGSLAAAAEEVGGHAEARGAADAAIGAWRQWRGLHEAGRADLAAADLPRSAALADEVDRRLAEALQDAQRRFEEQSVRAVDALAGADAAAALLALVGAVAAGLGLAPRIREYR
ncbi:hypothetical protein LZG04_26825 [Saccharothrix sp. S26]|uniref:hypothetical protein n=1 Tax=Saccharothrix sp. S26 TaxID=2907215 RepID=UPI001F1AE88B|nr:hypothetical protein [Saccharothrix sp. S26]MCE6998386.1 hypothetical protein [Saccharothrix sp. S26]